MLKGHSKAVTCLDVEHTGTRMVTGSMDYTIRLYDFHGMKSDMRSFRWGTCDAVCWLAGHAGTVRCGHRHVVVQFGHLAAGTKGIEMEDLRWC